MDNVNNNVKPTKKKIPQEMFFNDYQALMQDVAALSKNKVNPFFKSKYVGLDDVLQEVKRVCFEHNFIFYQTTEIIKVINDSNKDNKGNETYMGLRTTLKHRSQEKIESLMPIIAKDIKDPQKVGAGLTYMRRYSLTCIFGIQESDDDGGKAAQVNKSKKPVNVMESIATIRGMKDKKSLNDLKKNIASSTLYNQVQKKLIEQAIADSLKNAS